MKQKTFFGRLVSMAAVIACGALRLSAQTNCTLAEPCIYNWWPADGNARDIISGDDGTLENGAGFATGEVGEAFSLTATNQQYVSVPRNGAWGFGTNDFSIELWVNLRTWNPRGSNGIPDAIFIGDDNGGGTQTKWLFAINAGNLAFHVNSPGMGDGLWLANAPFSPVTNEWYHLAVTRQSNVFTTYIDGVAVGSETNSVSIPAPNAALTIGEAEGLGYIDGLIDEASIYQCALSAVDVSNIYDAGSYGKCPPTNCATPASCIYNWWPGQSNVTDIVSGDNGSLKNGAGFAPGIVGDAFDLTAADYQYISVPHDEVWGFGTNDFTVELWVNLRSWNPVGIFGEPDAIFIGDDDSMGSQYKWFFAINAGQLTFHINSPFLSGDGLWLVNANFNPNIDQWYHLAVTKQTNNYTIYVNGAAVGSQTDTNAIPDPEVPLTIGQCEELGYIDGLIDEVSIYRCALSASQINAIYQASSNGKCSTNSCAPVASCIHNWWPAEDNPNDIISGDTGILEDSAGYAPGLVGDAFHLVATNHSYVQVPHDNAWGFGTNDFSIELWVNFHSWNPGGVNGVPDAVFVGDDNGGGTQNKWLFAVNAGKLAFHVNAPGMGDGLWLANASFSPSTNQWYHLAVTRQSGVFTTYIDGTAVGSQTNSVSIPNPTAALTMGQAEGLGYIDGLIDEPSIYQCALSASQIQAIYNAGSLGKCR